MARFLPSFSIRSLCLAGTGQGVSAYPRQSPEFSQRVNHMGGSLLQGGRKRKRRKEPPPATSW